MCNTIVSIFITLIIIPCNLNGMLSEIQKKLDELIDNKSYYMELYKQDGLPAHEADIKYRGQLMDLYKQYVTGKNS